MIKKFIGYILAIIGLSGIALTFPQVKSQFTLPAQISALSNTVLTVASLAIIVIASFLILNKKEKHKAEEVPIYSGRNIIGYRRTR